MKLSKSLFKVWAVFKRELTDYFSSPVAYVFIIIFLMLSGFFTFYVSHLFEVGQAELTLFFEWHPWIFLLLIPAATMRLWSEEKKIGTIELIMTFPITLTEIILGKFFAAWIFIGIALIMTFPMILTVCYLGDPDTGAIFCSYIGSFLMAGAFISIGLMTSSLTKSQVISFILSVVLSLFFVLAGYSPVCEVFTGWTPVWFIDIITNLSFLTHFASIKRGVIDFRDLVYFFSIICFMLFCNGTILHNK